MNKVKRFLASIGSLGPALIPIALIVGLPCLMIGGVIIIGIIETGLKAVLKFMGIVAGISAAFLIIVWLLSKWQRWSENVLYSSCELIEPSREEIVERVERVEESIKETIETLDELDALEEIEELPEIKYTDSIESLTLE